MKMTTTNTTKESLISIVDDEACVRESLSSLLRSVGYEAKEYASAEDFLTWGWWDEAACLIIDVRLPAMGGLELQRYLAEKQTGRPVIFISGHATENEETWAMMRGAVGFLRKPFSDEALLKAVRESIARGRHRHDFHPQIPSDQLCPLCHESARMTEVPGRLMSEDNNLRASAVKLIKTLNPEWTEADGLCSRCWKFYLGLGRVVTFPTSPDTPPDANREGHSTAGIRQKE
jgi:FixJ family two-component response regulator